MLRLLSEQEKGVIHIGFLSSKKHLPRTEIFARVKNSPRGRFRFGSPRRTMLLAESDKWRGSGGRAPKTHRRLA